GAETSDHRGAWRSRMAVARRPRAAAGQNVTSYDALPLPSMPRFRFSSPGSGPNQIVNSERAKSSPGTVPRTVPRAATSTPASGHQVNDILSPFLTSPMSDVKREMDA